MTTNKQISINNKVFSYNAFLVSPEKYLPIMLPLCCGNSGQQKENESYSKYINRIFNLIHRRYGVGVISTNATRANNVVSLHDKGLELYRSQILNSLGIDIIKYNPKISKVLFKNSGNSYKMKNADMDLIAESIKKSVNFTRKKISVNLGIELEFIGNRNCMNEFEDAMRELVGNDKFQNKGCYNKNKGDMWILGTDGSVESHENWSSPMRGYELTSPILKFTKTDMNMLNNVLNLIKTKFGGYVNNTCGTHVHMSFNCENVTDELCRHFAKSYRYSETDFFDKLVPLRRRGNNSRWCRSTKVVGNLYNNRYQKLNFANVKLGSDNLHIEFRQLDGTLDFEKIKTWITLQKLFVELAMKTWKSSNSDNELIRRLNINDVVTNKEFNQVDLENIMKLGHLVA
jgi:hypothetical protein